ncbi:MAG: FAD-dependent oxidoreductase [Planctomycetota bacterium]|nr:FAD-dependent oxidoreductase [Planctomycetota bacterium]
MIGERTASGQIVVPSRCAAPGNNGSGSERRETPMAEILEDARMIPVAAEADVCVIGGSCTGVFAAVAAARMGARVVVVENNGFFGGVATAGLVNVWHKLYDERRERRIIGGLTHEIIDRLRKRRAVIEMDGGRGNFILNTEELKIELDSLVCEHNVRPFLHTRFCAPIIRDGMLEAAAIEDKTGRRAIRASFFIDASGDGDLIARMGLPFRKLEDLQPPTTCAIIRGIGTLQRHNPGFSLSKAVFNPAFPNALKNGFLWYMHAVGSVDDTMVAGTRVPGADCSDADQLTMAEIEARRQVRAICDILRNNFQMGECASLVSMASYIGVRETRHAECIYTLTTEDVLGGRRFDDAIANGTYPVDIHHSSKPGITFRHLDGRQRYCLPDGRVEESRWREAGGPSPDFYQIPYRCLVPKGARNVLVAGRLIDADRGAYGAIRVMVNCNQTGEAAGTAACLALKAGVSAAEVDAAKLRAALERNGVPIL